MSLLLATGAVTLLLPVLVQLHAAADVLSKVGA